MFTVVSILKNLMRLTIAFNDWLEVRNEHRPLLNQLSISKALKQPLKQ